MPLQTEIHIKCKVCVQVCVCVCVEVCVCVCLSDWQCVWNMQIIKIVLCYATVNGSRAKQTKRFWAFGQVRNGYKAKAERDSKRERRERVLESWHTTFEIPLKFVCLLSQNFTLTNRRTNSKQTTNKQPNKKQRQQEEAEQPQQARAAARNIKEHFQWGPFCVAACCVYATFASRVKTAKLISLTATAGVQREPGEQYGPDAICCCIFGHKYVWPVTAPPPPQMAIYTVPSCLAA